jgi:hypothetical protein
MPSRKKKQDLNNQTIANPIKKYLEANISKQVVSSTATPVIGPGMSTDGLIADSNYGYTGVVNTLNTSEIVYSAPQKGQIPKSIKTKLPSSKPTTTNYWSSPNDILGSSNITSIRIELKLPNTNSDLSYFNYLTFDFLNVPANWSAYYQNSITSSWLPLTDMNGNHIGGRTMGSVTNDWMTIGVRIQPVSTSLIEIRFDRNINNLNPNISQIFNSKNGYSFKIKNLDIRLIADEWNTVPTNAKIAVKNALGLTEDYVLNQKNSSQIQQLSNRNKSTNPNYYWRSSPQPTGDSVVSLYVDLGSTQTIDRMYLDPLYSGIKCEIYSSNDTTINPSFTCSRRQDVFSQKSTSNLVKFLNFGSQTLPSIPPSCTGAVIPDNSSTAGLQLPGNLNIVGTKSWSMGLKFATPYYTTTTGSYTGTLIEQKNVSLNNIPVQLSYTINYSTKKITFSAICNGTSISSPALNVAPYPTNLPSNLSNPSTLAATGLEFQNWTHYPYTLVIGYDDSLNQIYMYYNVQGITNGPSKVTATTNSPYPVRDPSASIPFVLGNNNTGTSAANGNIVDFWIRQDTVTSNIVSSFIGAPRDFVNGVGVKLTPLSGNYRALFLARLNDLTCFCGPSAEYYESKKWTPINVDLTLRKGSYSFPPTSARFIKLMFTHLHPVVYPIIAQEGFIKRRAKFYSADSENYRTNLENNANNTQDTTYYPLATKNTSSPGALQELSSNTNYGLSTLKINTPLTQSELNLSQSNVSTKYAKNVSSAIIDPTSQKSFLSLLKTQPNIVDANIIGSKGRKNTIPGSTVHNLWEEDIYQTWGQSYFVGLKALNFYKFNQTATDDTVYYYDTCSNAPSNTTLNNTTIFVSSVFSGQSLIPWVDANGYVASASNQYLYTGALKSFSNVTALQIGIADSDWMPFMPMSDTLMNNYNTSSYLIFNNCLNPIPISTFSLNSSVWSISPPQNSTASYGVKTKPIAIPSSINNTSGMRISGVARIYLPNTNNGTYQINLYATIGGTSTLVNSQTINSPLRNWTDLQLSWTVPEGSSITATQVEILQIDPTVIETFYLTMLSTFYKPIGWAYSTDGSNYKNFTSGINDPNSFTVLNSPTQVFYIRAKSYGLGGVINALIVKPEYQYNQNPYSSKVSIDYMPDPRYNEDFSKVDPENQAIFNTSSNYYPLSLSLINLTPSS